MKTCPHCCKAFEPKKPKAKYCSRTCAWANNGGQNRLPESWWTDPKGYIQGRIWVDGKRIHVKQHRRVVEQSLGRRLLPDEDVHHVNGIKSDNRIENLRVVKHGHHTLITNSERAYKRGYTLNITPEDRERRRRHIRSVHEARRSKARGEDRSHEGK